MKLLNIITIDGPSASGKSSVSRLVAKKLGWRWVSTGAFYRGLALASIRLNKSPNNENELTALAKSNLWEVKMNEENTEVFFQGNNVTQGIRGEDVGAVASKISQLPQVRQALLDRQRNCYDSKKGLVAEGRDCGTVVFPQALVKIYLTANPELRAARRSEEDAVSEEKTREMQKVRDQLDSQRKVAPLRKADGALNIDSSFLSLDEVAFEVIKYAQSLGVKSF